MGHFPGFPFALLSLGLFFLIGLSENVPVRARQPQANRVVLEVKGYLIPEKQVMVSPKVAGQVKELMVRVGKKVKEGDILAKFDSEELELNYLKAHVEHLKAQQELENRTNNGLNKGELKIFSLKELIAKTRYDKARLGLNNSKIQAPFSGTVLAIHAEVGAQVGPRGLGLLELATTDKLRVEVWIPERELTKVVEGQLCLIRVEANPKAQLAGKVELVHPQADKARGAVLVWVSLDGPARATWLRPNLGATVSFLGKE